MKFKEIINEALAGIKNPKALRAKACIVEPVTSEINSVNDNYLTLRLCTGGSLVFEYSASIEQINICAFTEHTAFKDMFKCNILLPFYKHKEYLRFSIENALKHIYFVHEKEIERRFRVIQNCKF